MLILAPTQYAGNGVPNRLHADLAQIDPAHASYYKANAASFTASLAAWDAAIAAFKAAHPDIPVATTEPVADYMLQAAGTGSGVINAMAHVRGHRAVYDAWAADGATGWGPATPPPRHSPRAGTTTGKPTPPCGAHWQAPGLTCTFSPSCYPLPRPAARPLTTALPSSPLSWPRTAVARFG